MLKYLNSEVTFAEIPDEISLCINITNCPNHCQGCHSKFLWEDVGSNLYWDDLKRMIDKNDGITCVCFMGGDSDPSYIYTLAKIIKQNYNLKTAWYSGRKDFPEDAEYLDYIKIGPYIEEKGPLTNPFTNQKLYRILGPNKRMDITSKFWRKNDN